MRVFMHLVAILVVMGFAWWAYGESYRTRMVREEVERLEDRIAATREQIASLRAEWAYLNRPERLKILAELNFPFLGLVSPGADAFADIDNVPFRDEAPLPALSPRDVKDPVFVAGPGRSLLLPRQHAPRQNRIAAGSGNGGAER